MKRFLLSLIVAAALSACADANPDGRIDAAPGGLPDSDASLTGVATKMTPFTPVTTNCTPPDELDPDGTVSSDDPPVCTDPETAPLGAVLVEADPDSQTGDKISFTISQDTKIFTENRDQGVRTLAEVGLDTITSGARVEAGYSGPVMDSYPQQTTADYLVLLDSAS